MKGGRRISYLMEGSGARTALLIHGSGMSARSWVNQLQHRPGALRMVAIDLPGHGESDPPAGESIDDYAAAVAEFLVVLDRGPAVVIGHSLGGSIAIALAARHPALVTALVLIASCVKLPLVDNVGERVVAFLPGPLRRLVFFSMAKKVLFAPDAPAGAIEITMRDLRACRPVTMMADVHAARAMDLTEQAAALGVPTLVLAGGRDRLTTPALAERLSALIRRSRLALADRAGHMLPQEAPEWVNREIATFVESLAEPVPASRALVAHRAPFLRRLFDWAARLALRRQAEDIKRN